MSYDINIVHPTARQSIMDGGGESEREPFSDATAARFIEHLGKLGYVLEFSDQDHQEFVKTVGKCPVPISLFRGEATFAVPYWEGADAAIAVAVADAVALARACNLAAFDPQSGEWLT